MFARICLCASIAWTAPALARADGRCAGELRELGVEFRPARHAHIDGAVEVRGPLGGVYYESWSDKPFVIDCRLAVALAKTGPYLAEHKIVRARFSNAYSRRRMRRSGRWSRHATGMAIDIHSFTRTDGSVLELRNHYEQGLGDAADCVGRALTEEGAVLRALACQLSRSGLFDNVLDPDYDAHHYNHFHLDVGE